MKLHLEIWRQAGPYHEGHFEYVTVEDAVAQMSILELLDHVNSGLIEEGKEPFAFASDCREGICGTCGLLVNGRPHGLEQNQPACQQRLLNVKDGSTLKIEPFRSAAFPVIKDMVVDRSALDRVMQQGGYVSVNSGTAPDADTLHMLHALVAVPVWPRAPMVPPTCLLVPSWSTCHSCPWVKKNAVAVLVR